MSLMNIIDELNPGWNTKKIDGASIQDSLKIESIELWWFYQRFLVRYVLPSYLKQKNGNLSENLSQGKEWFYSIFFRFMNYRNRKFLKYNESIKRKISKQNSPTGNIEREKALFLTYTNHLTEKGEIYRIEKIVQKISQEGILKPLVIFADPLSGISYFKIRKQNHTIYAFISEEVKKKAEEASQDLVKKWKSFNKKWLFGNQWEEVKWPLELFFSREFICHTALYYFAFKNLLQQQKVKAVVITASNGLYERCCMAAAFKLEIPVINIQHGEGLGCVNPGLLPGVTFAVFGDAYKERLTSWVKEKDIAITGPLTFDQICDYKKKSTMRKSGKITLITGPFVDNNLLPSEVYFEYINKILQATSPFYKEIIIKLHPRERMREEYQKVIEKNNFKNVMIEERKDVNVLYQLLSSSDLVINFDSTVALEAMILGKPILTINFQLNLVPNYQESPFIGGLIVTMNDNLKEAVKEAMDQKWEAKREQIVQKFCFKTDGKAAERMVELIYEKAGMDHKTPVRETLKKSF